MQQVVKVIWYKAASPTNMDGSLIFARWRQCAPHLVQPNWHPHRTGSAPAESLWVYQLPARHVRYVLSQPLSPSKLPLQCVGISTPSNTRFLDPPESTLKPHHDQFGRFCRLMVMTNRQTDRETMYSMCSNRPHLASALMQLNITVITNYTFRNLLVVSQMLFSLLAWLIDWVGFSVPLNTL